MPAHRHTAFGRVARSAALSVGLVLFLAAPAASADRLQIASTDACKEICFEYEDALSLFRVSEGQIKHFKNKVRQAEQAVKKAKTDAEKAKAEADLAKQKEFLERSQKTSKESFARVKASQDRCRKAIEASVPPNKTIKTNTCEDCVKEAAAYDKAANAFEDAKSLRDHAKACEANEFLETIYEPAVKKARAPLKGLSKKLEACEKKFCVSKN